MPRSTNDARLAERAFRMQWPLTRKVRREVIDTLVSDLKNEHAKTRIAAARALIMANGQNIERDRMDAGIDRPTVNVFLGKLDVLASDPRVIELNEEIIARLDGPTDYSAGITVGTGESDQQPISETAARSETVGRLGQGSDDIGLDHPDHLPPATRQE